jgi:hypothetical protein
LSKEVFLISKIVDLDNKVEYLGGFIMQFVLIHKSLGMATPEVMKFTIETAKQLCANPQAFVPGGKVIASYYAIGAQAIYCIWDVPNVEAFSDLLRNMSLVGWNTEVIPAESAEVAIGNIEKAVQGLMAQMMPK